jgi:hypothetical protein
VTGGVLRLAAAAALGWGIAGCGPAVSSSLPPASFVPVASAPTPTPVAASTAAATPAPAATPDGSAAVAIDPGLLAILPATVDGLPVVESPEGEAAALADPILPGVGRAVAAGFAIDPAGGDFVYAVVVQLHPDGLTDEAFRDWRDSFDEGACSQAAGVAGHAETESGGRTVYIGTCAGGLRTYHVRLEDRDVLISASAAGERRLGELLVEDLRP